MEMWTTQEPLPKIPTTFSETSSVPQDSVRRKLALENVPALAPTSPLKHEKKPITEETVRDHRYITYI
jgi:hypothetical protein